VWVVNRREAAFNDESGFAAGPDAAAGYYLDGKYRRQQSADSRYVAQWGLAAQFGDLREVVRVARAGGHRVVLSRHSWAAAIALACAAWDSAAAPVTGISTGCCSTAGLTTRSPVQGRMN
jgi:hypothetical protein